MKHYATTDLTVEKVYSVIDQPIIECTGDTFDDYYDTAEEAIMKAEASWAYKTDGEKKLRNIIAVEITRKDLSDDAFDEPNQIEWNCNQGYSELLWDSENLK